MKSTIFKYLALAATLSLMATGTAVACSTAAWTGGASGAVDDNDPNNGVQRVKGFCGLKATGTGHVQDNNPDAEATYNVRFYYFPQHSGAGSTDVFVAYSDMAATAVLFKVTYNGSQITVDASAAGGTSVNAPITSKWNLIEISWSSGGAGKLWVNADATVAPETASFTSGNGAVETVRLGAPNGFGGLTGMSTFDDFVSQRSTQVGLPSTAYGDANDDAAVNAGDINAIVNEFLSGALGSGIPDCNLDGAVNAGDINCVVNIFLGG